MGLSISASKHKSTADDESTKQKVIKPSMSKFGIPFGFKSKKEEASSKVHTKKKSKGVDEECISSSTNVDEIYNEESSANEDGAKVAPVSAFTGGFVNPVLGEIVNAHWGKTDESQLLLNAMAEAFLDSEVFVGDIEVRSSFITRTKGAMLL